MYLHIINVMRSLEPPSLDVSFSTYLLCTNYRAGLFPGIEINKKKNAPCHSTDSLHNRWRDRLLAARVFFCFSPPGRARRWHWGVRELFPPWLSGQSPPGGTLGCGLVFFQLHLWNHRILWLEKTYKITWINPNPSPSYSLAVSPQCHVSTVLEHLQ